MARQTQSSSASPLLSRVRASVEYEWTTSCEINLLLSYSSGRRNKNNTSATSLATRLTRAHRSKCISCFMKTLNSRKSWIVRLFDPLWMRTRLWSLGVGSPSCNLSVTLFPQFGHSAIYEHFVCNPLTLTDALEASLRFLERKLSGSPLPPTRLIMGLTLKTSPREMRRIHQSSFYLT